jgi:MFS family permease
VAAGWSRPAAIVVAVAFFLENFDGVILVTASPAIARDFGVPAADVGSASTAYLLAVAVFIPVSGWAADRWGARRVFCVAIAVFVVASLLCSLSSNIVALVGARVLQGIGGSMMVPVGRLIVLRETDKRDLLRAIAFLTWRRSPAGWSPITSAGRGSST